MENKRAFREVPNEKQLAGPHFFSSSNCTDSRNPKKHVIVGYDKKNKTKKYAIFLPQPPHSPLPPPSLPSLPFPLLLSLVSGDQNNNR